MNPRVPRTRCSDTKTEAAFFSWIRSALRKLSIRWKPRNDARIRARRPYKGRNKRLRWEYQCAQCLKWFPDKEVQVDHIIECGTLKKWEDLPGFASRLFCEIGGFQVLCKKRCHQSKTNVKHEKE